MDMIVCAVILFLLYLLCAWQQASLLPWQPAHYASLLTLPSFCPAESMNTVLDDNCTLCLPNGERIKLNPVTMRMLFEVQDLAVASPATVSRCGMVYISHEELGWRPYVQTWLQQTLPKVRGPLCLAAALHKLPLVDAIV
jgi:hypothetical protein